MEKQYRIIQEENGRVIVTADELIIYWDIVRDLIKTKTFKTIKPVPDSKHGTFVWELKK